VPSLLYFWTLAAGADVVGRLTVPVLFPEVTVIPGGTGSAPHTRTHGCVEGYPDGYTRVGLINAGGCDGGADEGVPGEAQTPR
jgi:hypothetical protein